VLPGGAFVLRGYYSSFAWSGPVSRKLFLQSAWKTGGVFLALDSPLCTKTHTHQSFSKFSLKGLVVPSGVFWGKRRIKFEPWVVVLQTCCFLWSSQIVSKLRVLMALRVCMVRLRFFASCCLFFSVWSCPLLCHLFEEWVHVMPKCLSVRLCAWVFYSVQTCILVLLQRFLWAEIFLKTSSSSLGIIFISEYSYSWRLFGFVESCNTSLCLSLPLLVCPSFWICARVPTTHILNVFL
jgi:hypothetical protein